jgi:hypothetical protein
MTRLPWPAEIAAAPGAEETAFGHAGSNLVLDLHGDPAGARLAVFSDGNHHMALVEALAAFARDRPQVGEPFFATTPPRVVAEWLPTGALRVGNLRLSVRPHAFISPPAVLERLRAGGAVGPSGPVARNRGAVLLVARGNPRGIHGVEDLARGDVSVFLSNPVTEKVSFEAYLETLHRLAGAAGTRLDFIDAHGKLVPSARVVLGQLIHHREAPQAVASGTADCAVVFSHLGLRYTRIFPEHFDAVPLGREELHVKGEIHVAVVGDGGEFGAAFAAFLRGPVAAAIYRHHGMDVSAPTSRSR